MNSQTVDANVIKSQLQSLDLLKQKTQALIDVKNTLLSKTELLEQKKGLLEQINTEKQRLSKEKRLLFDMLQSIQRDLDSVTEVETQLTREHEELEKNVTKYRIEQYEPLQDEVNEIRAQSGMIKLPHIQQELEAQMAKRQKDEMARVEQQKEITK
ncbi:hypothetical protein G6F70_004538 [Rhizopus microsporus]|uniref:Uncharacterized protein n=2 Tax=Rhizopus TaxID=4842 RepID=A0A367IY88_RHIAZ|nr:hypothetical protein G6F71_000240 [Rhizopus microsporus]RCH82622.1 hypothetical protein CU097_005936 [Rhizopus azygosporus]KAG1199860.1 hypothetical protein G6F70_004538 [Rhizopus microsporus]KAG1211549.1 hypothetical protein G6F69_004505 [Rhizopus microsporus]KAG1233487.1 hypothetical protein G6F67_004241 [Rhizopus microsporus]